jgi:hypothetical protein
VVVTTPLGSNAANTLYMYLTPEITVRGKGVEIASGDATPSASDDTDFGSADITGGTVVRTFTIGNSGNDALVLTGTPKVSLTGASEFSVTTQPTSPVAVEGEPKTFAISFAPTSFGTKNAVVTIASDDLDEASYTFAITGTGNVFTQSYALRQSGTSASVSSGTSETVLATIKVPARSIGVNGTLRVSADWGGTNNANNKWLRVRLGGIGGAELQQGNLANAAQASSICKIQNRNSASSQIGTATTSKSNNTIVFWLASGAIDTANDQDIVITAQPTVGGDSITLEAYVVEILPS